MWTKHLMYICYFKNEAFFCAWSQQQQQKNSNHDSVVQSFGEGSLEPLSLKRYVLGTVFTV